MDTESLDRTTGLALDPLDHASEYVAENSQDIVVVADHQECDGRKFSAAVDVAQQGHGRAGFNPGELGSEDAGKFGWSHRSSR